LKIKPEGPKSARGALPFILLVLCILLAGGEARAEEKLPIPRDLPVRALTIQDAVQYGLAHNPIVQAADEDVKSAEQGVKAAKADFLPRLDGSYSFTQWQDKPIAKITDLPGAPNAQFQTSDTTLNHWQAQVTQPLFQGFGIQARHEMAKQEKQIADYNRSETELNLVRDIRQAFIRVLYAQKVIEVVQQNVIQLKSHYDDAVALHRQGLTARNDMLKADVALADAVQREKEAVKQLSVLRSQLNRLLGIEESAALELIEWDKVPPSDGTKEILPPLNELFLRAEKNRPELASIAAGIREAEEGVRLARSTAYPRVSAFGTYYREGKDFLATENDFSNEHNAAVGVKVDWNFFEGGKMRANISQWQHRREALKKRRSDLVKQIQIEVKDSFEQLDVACANLATARVAVKQAEENQRITNIQYREQMAIETEVLDAQSYLVQARNNYYAALYGYQFAWANLERSVAEHL
jgi:outer membrane protein